MEGKISSDMLRGHTDTIILSILAVGDSYGYEIAKTIQVKTEDRFELKEATLYSSFRRLEQDACISSYWGDETQGGRRKYYSITERGRQMRLKNIQDWRLTNNILAELFEEEKK